VSAVVNTAVNTARFDRLDALRGLAIVWMVVFHFFFDLNHFGFIAENFRGDPFWTRQRICIVSLFLFCAGLSQAVALHQAQPWARFWRRWAQVAACALVVSLASWWVFPQSFISFGVLHGIALMLILVRLLAAGLGSGPGLWLIGALAIAMPFYLQHPWFDSRLTNWVGLVTHKPRTEDFVPLLPWVGVMCWGLACGQWVMRRKAHWFSGALPRVMQPLALLGRWSLTVYMVHQPLFFALLGALVWLRMH
jgi:uncharacterized membrane protein